MNKLFPLIAVLFLLNTSCQAPVEEVNPSDSITAEDLVGHIKTLGSDAFMGRMPFTEGEIKTIEYLKSEFKRMGLEPGNGESYFQEVPMVEIEATVTNTMQIKGADSDMNLEFKKDFVALTRRVTEEIVIEDSEIVFAGFGVVAPEYDWNDYKDLDVKGKTVLVLVNDPGFGTGDDSFFKGDAMTYYGRWTYKYEEAARQGAESIIIVHDTKPASYPWGVVENGWTGANLYLMAEDNNKSRCAAEGWVSLTVAEQMFVNAGMADYDFTAEARKRDFKALSLNQTMSLALSNSIKTSKSQNVVAKYSGTDLVDEYIIYSAHWDHLGIGSAKDGDSIYNGAIDNATGVALILEAAEAFTKLTTKTKRSVIFLAVTAEEQGLLGSAHYAENPIYPVSKTVANINTDALNPISAKSDIEIVGYGQSELEDYAREIADKQGRKIKPDPNPGAGSFFRSDHFNFAKVGIPALYAKGSDVAYDEHYAANDYHQPSDEYSDDWDMSGITMDAKLLFEVGLRISNETTYPKWKDGSEFKAIREESMKE